MKSLRGHLNEDFIMNEMDELEREKALKSSQNNVKFSDFINNPVLRRPLIITIVIQIAQVIII